MFLLSILLTLVAVYFAKQDYDDGRIGSAMFWSALFGWDLHAMLNYL